MKMSLRASRVNAGLTLRQASKELGVAFSTLIRWEHAPEKIQAWQQLKLSDLYKMPVDNIEWATKDPTKVEESVSDQSRG